MELAALGGVPITRAEWPRWPILSEEAKRFLDEVGRSGRWAVSGPVVAAPLQQQLFAEEFAHFSGAAHAVPCSSGSSALSLCLEALGIGPGDEVVVPALTWVATATSVMATGAIPVVVDVDPRTLALDPSRISEALTERTRAVIAVHYGCCVAPLDSLQALAERRGFALVEDCAQAHGARFQGRGVGTWGQVGAFSLQQTKLLTCGEGGVAITNDARLAQRMDQARLDGRVFNSDLKRRGVPQLLEVGEVRGRNYSMSEFQAAVARGQLRTFSQEAERRETAANAMGVLLKEVPGVLPVEPDPEMVQPARYLYVVQIDVNAFSGFEAMAVAEALDAELGAAVQTLHAPLGRHALFGGSSWFDKASAAGLVRIFPAPGAERVWRTHVAFPHSVLLADPSRFVEVQGAFLKVQRLSSQLIRIVDSHWM